MEANKENLISKTTQIKTRIPVPVEPLPLLPSHLINKMTNAAREPLKMIHSSNAANLNLPIQRDQEMKPDKKLTFKTTRTQQDWTQNVFNDKVEITDKNTDDLEKSEDCTTIKDKSTENYAQEELIAAGGEICNFGKPLIEHNIAFVVCESDKETRKPLISVVNDHSLHIGNKDTTIVTPTAVIEHKQVKNVKKSLKRPHSRELQGLSPGIKIRNSEDKVKRRLTFDNLGNNLSSDYCNQSECLDKEYSVSIFPYLMNAERPPLGIPHISCKTRACVINWLIKIDGPYGNPAVIQTACWFFDSYLSSKQVPVSKIQVIVAASYWIAQKLHGSAHSASKMVGFGAKAFSTDALRAAEMMVLLELKFPSQPVIPQEFISYMSWFCDRRRNSEIEQAATFLCMAGLMVDRTLCREQPSVIAAAAMKAAVLLLGSRDVMNLLVMCPVYQKCIQKFANLHKMTQFLRQAARTVASPSYQYNALRDHYTLPPHRITLKLIAALK